MQVIICRLCSTDGFVLHFSLDGALSPKPTVNFLTAFCLSPLYPNKYIVPSVQKLWCIIYWITCRNKIKQMHLTSRYGTTFLSSTSIYLKGLVRFPLMLPQSHAIHIHLPVEYLQTSEHTILSVTGDQCDSFSK